MKLKHQIAAGAALIFLVGCSQDQPMGSDKDASTTAAYTNTNDARESAKAPVTPHSTSAPAQTNDSQASPTPTNPPPAVPPSNPPADHQ